MSDSAEEVAEIIRERYGESAEEAFWGRYGQNPNTDIVDWPTLKALKDTGVDDYILEARRVLIESGVYHPDAFKDDR